jgi:predicted phosphodiesterase
MRTLFIGDSHGNALFIRRALDVAKQSGTKLCIQVGDFGFWPKSGFATAMDALLKEVGMPMWVIDGNHDYLIEAYTFLSEDVFSMEPGIHYIPRGSVTKVNDVILGFMGGAVSVDQSFRVEGKSWWANEIMNTSELDICKANGKVDIWITHDAVEMPPNKRPIDFGYKVNQAIKQQQYMMRQAYDAVQPKFHIHGHWHYRYSCDGKWGRVQGLDFEDDSALFLVDLWKGGYSVA